jgi:hypothetical protein
VLSHHTPAQAIWSISAAPLIMGNDVRNITAGGRAILLVRTRGRGGSVA